ncbi:hypothetical protein EVJ58_g1188 [Rhodofomes roseus]|uniref:AB hydrolase-1 domain-containing protein n=1 Tax=Rhodofomes roseus TaxID=34475 RepID=A0A4Y9Z285_9APHY|nr:hypothetical protein EVJ58_g1188 [Rhodofomes roseus]
MANPSAQMKEGTIPFTYQGETFDTHYKVFGELANRSRPPLLVLHGGPGLTHGYLLPLSDLALVGIPVILYDQIGNGASTHLRQKATEFWTIDLFVAELVNLVKKLDIEKSYDILGHSWGGVLGAEYEVREQPKGLRHLVLSNALAAAEIRSRSVAQLAQAISREVQEGLAVRMKDPQRYYAALKALHAKHGCTVQPTPPEVVRSFDCIFAEDGDPTVSMTSIMKDWTIIDRLHRVLAPTLVINGRKDFMQDFVVAPFFEKINKVKWITFEQSSHCPFWEERQRYMEVIDDFLKL